MNHLQHLQQTLRATACTRRGRPGILEDLHVEAVVLQYERGAQAADPAPRDDHAQLRAILGANHSTIFVRHC